MANDFFSISFDEKIAKATRVAQELYEESMEKAIDDVSPSIPEDLETIYWEAVHAWYGSYSPLMYKRHNSLYGLLWVEHGGNAADGIGWKITDDNMTRASWGNGSFNPWYQIYYGGYHGGPIGMRTDDGDYITKWSPPHSAPIPQLFDISKQELEEEYSNRVKAIVRSEVQKNFSARFAKAK